MSNATNQPCKEEEVAKLVCVCVCVGRRGVGEVNYEGFSEAILVAALPRTLRSDQRLLGAEVRRRGSDP